MKIKHAKRSLALLLAFMLTFSMLIGLSATTLADGDVVINILHTNDVHGRFYADANNSAMIGIDKVAAIRSETPNSILVDAGDALHGLPLVNQSEGMNAVKLMVAAGYTVMTPGNHEFNYGFARLTELAAVAAEGGLDLISSNIYDEDGNAFLDTTKIVEIEGVKVGFFGLTTLTTPDITIDSSALDFRAYKASAESAIAELRSAGAQVIVGLAHVTRSEIEDLIGELADKPDIILEGHDHTLGSTEIGGVVVASTGEYQENLGIVTVTVGAGGEITDITAGVISRADTAEIEGDADVKEIAEEMKAELAVENSKVVATSEIALSHDRGSDDGAAIGVRNSEQALGNLVADAMRLVSGSDVALTNGGGLRATIKVGDLTLGDIREVLPFGNWLTVIEISAADLYTALQSGLSRLPATNGGFPQISGMDVVYDLSASSGRVISITIDGEVLDRNDKATTFTLATNNFLALGRDGYDVFGDLEIVAEFGSLDDILIQHIAGNLGGTITAENTKIDGRLAERPGATFVAGVDLAISEGLVPANMQRQYIRTTTRLEFAQLAVLLYETWTGEEIEVGDNPFTDTEDVNAIKAFAIKVTTGQGDGSIFNPDGTLTRQQAATMLERLARALGQPLPAEAPVFTDSNRIAGFAINAVGAVQAAGIMTGISGGRFDPLGSYSRQQSIITIARLFEKLEVVEEAPDLAA